MKKILFFISMLLLVACNGVIDPVVIPDPTLILSVSKDTVNPGDVVTISVIATNAIKTESNINAPSTTQWSKDITVTEDLKISVSAFNAAGVKIEKSANITVVVPYVPNRTDSIYSMVWSYSAYDNLDKDGNVVISWNLNEDQKTNKLYFYKDGNAKVFNKNGTQIGSFHWKWTGTNTILIGDQTYRYILDDTKFYRYQSSNDGTEIYRQTYTGVKL